MPDFESGGLGVDSLEGSPTTCGASWVEMGSQVAGLQCAPAGPPPPGPQLRAALNPDYTMHLLSLPLLQSNVIRKICFS